MMKKQEKIIITNRIFFYILWLCNSIITIIFTSLLIKEGDTIEAVFSYIFVIFVSNLVISGLIDRIINDNLEMKKMKKIFVFMFLLLIGCSLPVNSEIDLKTSGTWTAEISYIDCVHSVICYRRGNVVTISCTYVPTIIECKQ